MNRRAFMISFVVAALGAILLILYLRRFENERSGGEPVKVLVAKKAIERGKPITEDSLAVREIPVAYVEDRAIRASERDKVLDLRMGVGVSAQQVLMWTDLAIANEERRDLSSLIAPGNRAVYIRAMQEDKGSALIRPGDYVDVIATLSVNENKVSVVLLQKVLVLANGVSTSSDGTSEKDTHSSGMREQGLTLSLNLQEAQLTALATERGQFTVALRNPDDPRTFEGIPDMNASALMDNKVRAAAQVRRSGPVKLEAAGGAAR